MLNTTTPSQDLSSLGLHVSLENLAVDLDGLGRNQDEHHSRPLVGLVPPLVDAVRLGQRKQGIGRMDSRSPLDHDVGLRHLPHLPVVQLHLEVTENDDAIVE